MSIKILTFAIACGAFAATASAQTNWVGAQMQFPVPGADVGSSQLGIDTGVSITLMNTPYSGIGADVVYHYWPASTGYAAAFNRYLTSTRFEALDGSDWAFTALQLTIHMKLAPPVSPRYAPWAKLGVGTYRLNWNLDERRPADTYAWVEGPGMGNKKVVLGGYGQLGLSIRASAHIALGVDATLHHLWSHEKSWSGTNDLPDFSAFALGSHVMFGWR